MSETTAKKDQNCGNCYFGEPGQNDMQFECHCNPPQLLIVPASGIQGAGVAVQPIFPLMSADAWCGKWMPGESRPKLTVA